MKKITWNEFQNVELRIWTIIDVQDFPKAKIHAYKITVDFWKKIWIKKSSAQITTLYTKKELIWKQIIWVINFPKKQIADFMSEFLVTGFVQEDKSVILAVPDKKIENWLKLS
jgi:tRNA-binding protein